MFTFRYTVTAGGNIEWASWWYQAYSQTHSMKVIDMDFAASVKEKAAATYQIGETLNKAVVDSVEQLAQAGVESAGYYSGLGVQQLRALSAVKNVNSLREYFGSTISVFGEITKRAIADVEIIAKAGVQLKGQVTDLVGTKAAV